MTKKRIVLDRPRTFLLDLASVARFEQNVDKAFFRRETWTNLSMRETALLLWACLVHEDKNLKPEDALAMMRKMTDEKVAAVTQELLASWANVIEQIADFRR